MAVHQRPSPAPGERAPGGAPPAGVCFGYEVRSAMSFTYLRAGSGIPLRVAEADEPGPEPAGDPLLEWRPRPDNPFQARLYESGGSYDVWIDGVGRFSVDPVGPAITVPREADPIAREERLWGIPAALCFAQRGDVPIHAAAVDVGGRALLFAGPGRFGKTTLAAAFLRAGHRVLSEDVTCCRLDPGPAVLPGPAMLRIRRDVFERLDVPGTRPVAEDPERIHLAIDESTDRSGDPIPLAGVVFLRRGAPDLTLIRVPGERWLPELWTVSFNLPTDEDRARNFRAIADLAAAVPLWLLDRPLEFANLERIVDHVASTCPSP